MESTGLPLWLRLFFSSYHLVYEWAFYCRPLIIYLCHMDRLIPGKKKPEMKSGNLDRNNEIRLAVDEILLLSILCLV